nr:MAG TPA: hypothetical protein [Caudoviricetes sp.]
MRGGQRANRIASRQRLKGNGLRGSDDAPPPSSFL